MSVSVPVTQLSEAPSMAPKRRAASSMATSPSQLSPRLGAALVKTTAFAAAAAALVVGWGLEQLLVLFAHPARVAVLGVMTLFYAVSVAQTLAAPAWLERPRPIRVTWFRTFMAGSLLLVLSSAFLDGRVLYYLPGAEATRYAGATLFAVGALLVTWAARRFESSRLASNAGWILMLLGLPMTFLSQIGLLGGLGGAALILFRAYRKRKTAGK